MDGIVRLRFLASSTLAVFLLLTVLDPVAAAGTLTGRVVDPDGRPIAGARVLVAGEDAGLTSVTTGADGRFSIVSPETGRLTLRVAAQGFAAEVVTLGKAAGAHDVGTIQLAVSALSESIVVSASQVETPLTQVTSSVTIIDGAEIEARQIHSVADALRTVPGLTVVSAGGVGTTTGVFPRGGESNYTLAIVDGVPVNAFGGDFDFAQVSTANIDRIEVVRGPQSALYGSNAIGAVVRIMTRKGGPPSGQVSAETGGDDTSRIRASTSGSHAGLQWGASFDRLLSGGMNGERTAAGEEVVNDDYERGSGAALLGWRGESTSVEASARYSTDDRGFPGPFGTNPIGAFTGIDRVSRGANDRTTASLAYSTRIGARTRAQAQAGYNRLDSDFASAFGASQSFSRRWTARTQADASIGHGVDVSAGVEVQRERAGSTFITGHDFQEIPIRRVIAGYFGEGRWNARDRLFVTAGLRVEDIRRQRIEDVPDPFLPRPVLPADRTVSANPRLSAAWLARVGAASYTRLRGSVGTGIRPPDAFDLAFTDNAALKPERSVSAEAGVDHTFASGHGLVEATAFANRYDDLIVAVGSFREASRYMTDNISNARARGLELALTLRGRIHARLPVDLSARVSYTRLATKILAVDGETAAPPPFSVGEPLPRRPAHQFGADVSAAAGRLTAFLRGGGRSSVLDVEPSLGTFGGLFDAAGYQTWSTGAAFRVARAAEIFGRIENLFDSSYEEALGFRAPGRRATVGLRLVAGR